MGVPIFFKGNTYAPRPMIKTPPTASFTADKTSGAAPCAIRFIDGSTGQITAWSWNFGDGVTSKQDSPTHIYNAAGTYNVSLTVSSPNGSSTQTRNGYITVS